MKKKKNIVCFICQSYLLITQIPLSVQVDWSWLQRVSGRLETVDYRRASCVNGALSTCMYTVYGNQICHCLVLYHFHNNMDNDSLKGKGAER